MPRFLCGLLSLNSGCLESVRQTCYLVSHINKTVLTVADSPGYSTQGPSPCCLARRTALGLPSRPLLPTSVCAHWTVLGHSNEEETWNVTVTDIHRVCESQPSLAKPWTEGKAQCISHSVHVCVRVSLAGVEPRAICLSTNLMLGKCYDTDLCPKRLNVFLTCDSVKSYGFIEIDLSDDLASLSIQRFQYNQETHLCARLWGYLQRGLTEVGRYSVG